MNTSEQGDSDIIIGSVFDIGWEQKPGIDTCVHQWEPIRYVPYPGGKLGTVEKCSVCGVPRCGRSNDSGYCTDRRHHDSVHIFPDGEFDALGGIVPNPADGGGV